MASKRDYYAEEQAIEIEKLRVENKENVENHETICTFLTTQEASDPNSQFAKILELEAEVRILKASNKKYKIQISEQKILFDEKFFKKALKTMKSQCDYEYVDPKGIIKKIRTLGQDSEKVEAAFLSAVKESMSEMMGDGCFHDMEDYQNTIDSRMDDIFGGMRLPNKYDRADR